MEQVTDKVYRWGDHDETAIQQIMKCTYDGRAVAGALMADGHMGYSMPIGGVVGYKNLVSPSGVGFDIACIAEGTEITTGSGEIIKITPLGGIMIKQPIHTKEAMADSRTKISTTKSK